MVATTAKHCDDPEVVEDRTEQFVEMAFTVEEAKLLAKARKSDGNYWRINEVQRMIDHPECDHNLALDLIT